MLSSICELVSLSGGKVCVPSDLFPCLDVIHIILTHQPQGPGESVTQYLLTMLLHHRGQVLCNTRSTLSPPSDLGFLILFFSKPKCSWQNLSIPAFNSVSLETPKNLVQSATPVPMILKPSVHPGKWERREVQWLPSAYSKEIKGRRSKGKTLWFSTSHLYAQWCSEPQALIPAESKKGRGSLFLSGIFSLQMIH